MLQTVGITGTSYIILTVVVGDLMSCVMVGGRGRKVCSVEEEVRAVLLVMRKMVDASVFQGCFMCVSLPNPSFVSLF